jgi:hypothetical protein
MMKLLKTLQLGGLSIQLTRCMVNWRIATLTNAMCHVDHYAGLS